MVGPASAFLGDTLAGMGRAALLCVVQWLHKIGMMNSYSLVTLELEEPALRWRDYPTGQVRPRHAALPHFGERATDQAMTDAQGLLRDLIGQLQVQDVTKNFTRLAHTDSLTHRRLLKESEATGSQPRTRHQTTDEPGPFGPESTVTFDRNPRSLSTGIRGHIRPESTVTLGRNAQRTKQPVIAVD